MCSLKDGKFKLTETKIQQLKKLGIIKINNYKFDKEFIRLYDILITGKDNPKSKEFGVCPLNYCKKNMDRMEVDDELKRITNSCMYRHKNQCILNWSEASVDTRIPYHYWNEKYDTCVVNKLMWQYRTMCDCATNKGNGLIGSIQNNELKFEKVSGSPLAMLGDNIPISKMFNAFKDNVICSQDKSMQAYTCDDLTNLSGEDYNNMGVSAGKAGTKGSLENLFSFNKAGYSNEDRAKIITRLTAELSAETDYIKKEKINMQLELLKNSSLDIKKHSTYSKMKGKFEQYLGCKCNIELLPNTGDWKTDSVRLKKGICEGSLGVKTNGLANRSIDWNDENHSTYPNACVTNQNFCEETGGCWFFNRELNPPNGYDDCEITLLQGAAEAVLGTTFTRLSKKAFDLIPGVKELTCLR